MPLTTSWVLSIPSARMGKSPVEWNCSTVKKECLAMLLGVCTFRPYLVGMPFEILTVYNDTTG